MEVRTQSSQAGLPYFAYLWAILAATVFLLLRFFLRSGVPIAGLGDQILFFGRAVHILQGKIIYRDFFELVTPGTDLLYAALFKVFGVRAWVMSACAVGVGLTTFLVITSIAVRIFQGPMILLPGCLFLIFDFSSASDLTHHWYSTLAALAATSLLIRGTGLGRSVGAAWLCALSVLFTQTQGGLVFVAILIYLLWWSRRKNEWLPLVAFVLIFAAIVSTVLGYYVYRSGLHAITFDLIEFPVKFLSSGDVNSPRTYLRQFPALHSPSDLFRTIPYLFIYALVPYAYLFGLYKLWINRRRLAPEVRGSLILLHLVGIALFLAVASGPRFFRLSTVAPPAILIFVWLLRGEARAPKISRNLLWVATAVFAVALPVRRQMEWHGVLDLPIGRTAFLSRQDYQEFQWMAQHTHPGDRFFNKTALSLFLELDTPTQVELINDEDFTRPEQVAAVMDWFKQRPAKFIVMYPKGARYSSASNSEPFRRYVESNDRIAHTFPLSENNWTEEVWEPRP